MRLIVREAAPPEFEAIAELTVDAYRTIDPDLGSYEARIRDVAGRAEVATVLVAIADGRIAGTATYVDGPGPLAESDAPGDAGIRFLAVAPDEMGHGIGTALTRHCIDLARAAGKRRIVLLTRDRMRVAHRLYEGLGFERAPEHDEPLPGDHRLLGYVLALDGS